MRSESGRGKNSEVRGSYFGGKEAELKMTTYVMGRLRNVVMGHDLAAYLKAIDPTLEPFGGEFLVLGPSNLEVLEGDFSGQMVVIAFPDRASAKAWYHSPTYQRIRPLRASHCDLILVDRVPDGYKAVDFLR